LFFVFIFPYFFFIFLSILKVILNSETDYYRETYFRQLSSVLAYSNAVISPTIMLLKMPDFKTIRRDFMNKLTKCSRGRHCTSFDIQSNVMVARGLHDRASRMTIYH
jgi:hypothetical protein